MLNPYSKLIILWKNKKTGFREIFLVISFTLFIDSYSNKLSRQQT
jgi:hypothetical protein